MPDTPTCSNKFLDNDPYSKPRVQKCNFRAVVGFLGYYNDMVRPDTTMATQQCSRFWNSPSSYHKEAVKRICRHVFRLKDKCLVLRPYKQRGLECYVGSDWSGSWQDKSSNDPLLSHFSNGYALMFSGCSIMMLSKMQPLIELITTEAEYIALSAALLEII